MTCLQTPFKQLLQLQVAINLPVLPQPTANLLLPAEKLSAVVAEDPVSWLCKGLAVQRGTEDCLRDA
jgi:hypothetical protein